MRVQVDHSHDPLLVVHAVFVGLLAVTLPLGAWALILVVGNLGGSLGYRDSLATAGGLWLFWWVLPKLAFSMGEDDA